MMEKLSINRDCPICGSKLKENIFTKEFIGMESIAPFKKYDVCICRKCGMSYAANMVENMSLAEYYQRLSKYETKAYKSAPSSLREYKISSSMIRKYVKEDESIVDVGCGFGGLLYTLSKEGYNNLVGIEPSAKNVEYINKTLGIEAIIGEVSELQNLAIAKRFRLIAMEGVLEHIIDIKTSIRYCANNLTENGYLFLVVPDVGEFCHTEDVYQQFSVEHINYFSQKTLQNLCSLFNLAFVESVCDEHGGIYAVFQKKNNYSRTMQYDDNGVACIKQYVHDCEMRAKHLQDMLNSYRGRHVYLWGAGTHTSMLFQLGLLDDINIVNIIDNNKNYKGLLFNGYKVLNLQDDIINKSYPIIISSQYAQDSIEKDIKDVFKLANECVKLY